MEQTSETGSLDATLISRRNNMDRMSQVKEIESTNPKIAQKQIGEETVYSNSTLKRIKLIFKNHFNWKVSQRDPSNILRT